MKNKLAIGIVLGVMIALVGVGLLSLVRGRHQGPSVSASPSNTSPAAINASPSPAFSTTSNQKQVVINGRALTDQQLKELEAIYRVQPQPGRYWYDTRSGLYGVVGAAAAGFMYPGHDLGPLAADASAGSSGVYFNGRNLTAPEVQILSYLAQTQVQPGRYWLDGQGNAGYEGNDVPVGNLFAAARAAQQSGEQSSGGGDNFWSTRFSAGNYNSDNSAGYVSLPNGGIVSYGY